ncbi:MAG: DNA polymerase III subunit beta [Chloroflexi bacterium]|nr:DNA polymerase III subunit beta [Chloroflexota bacterium]
MKLSCTQENLAKGLALVGRAVATRSTLPVLSNILLATDNSRLKLAATNLEVSINCWIGADVQQEGSTTVPARLLTDLVNSLTTERIDLELIARTQTLNLKSGRFEANIKGIDSQEFPIIMVPEEDNRVTIDPDALRQMIDQVAFAASADDSRPVLTGVQVSVNGEELTFAAADGYRCSVRSMDIDTPAEEGMSVIVPARAMQELGRVSVEQQQPIEMLVDNNRNQVFFHMENIDLVSQIIEGAFPDIRQIIPSVWNTRIHADTADLLKAARTALIFARDAANVVRLQAVSQGDGDMGRLLLTATSPEHGDNVNELDIQMEGKPVEIAFNARYLIDVLSVIDTAQMVIELRDATSPGVIKPVGGVDFVHIIMPMHIAH